MQTGTLEKTGKPPWVEEEFRPRWPELPLDKLAADGGGTGRPGLTTSRCLSNEEVGSRDRGDYRVREYE